MPAISFSPVDRPLAPASAPDESVAAATSSQANNTSPQATDPVELQSDNVGNVKNSKPFHTPPQTFPAPNEEPELPGLRYSRVPRARSPALIPVTPNIMFPSVAGPATFVSDSRSPQALHPFSRPTNNLSRIIGLPQFREFSVIRNVLKFSELFGRDVDPILLPSVVHERDVEVHEWELFTSASIWITETESSHN